MKTWQAIAISLWFVLPALAAQAQAPDAQALARARREADGPLRLILEAGKIKPRAKVEPDARFDAKAQAEPDPTANAGKPAAHAVAAKPPTAAPEVRDLSPEATRAAALASVRTRAPQTAAPSVAKSTPPPSAPAASAANGGTTAPAKPEDAAADAQAAAAAIAPPAARVPAEAKPPAITAPIEPAAAASAPRAAPPDVASTGPRHGIGATRESEPQSPSAAGPAISTNAAPAAVPASNAEAASAPTARAGGEAGAPDGVVDAGAGAGAEAAADANPHSAPAVLPEGDARVALAVSPPTLPQPPATLEVSRSVQLEVPPDLVARMRRDGEVVVDFLVNADGTVADASVQASNNPALDAIALDALRQWRYQPLAQPRRHRVQFVFKRE